ncbi:MAG TPA: hypothetical protein VI875_02040 [Candidatus Norongarragalinales archaeon]|nr:hypothetical protein [Candidatus Norongarragalinales archaeon]
MQRLIRAIQLHNETKVIEALKEPSVIYKPDGNSELDAHWLIEKVKDLKEQLPGEELSDNDRLRKRVLGALIGEAMMARLNVDQKERELVRRVIAKRTALDHIEPSGLAHETMKQIYDHFDKLKDQLKTLHANEKINSDEFYSIWDHAANGAIYFTP